jgi:hypothetical protein
MTRLGVIITLLAIAIIIIGYTVLGLTTPMIVAGIFAIIALVLALAP